MFIPKHTITPKLLENIKKIGILIANLNNRRFSLVAIAKLEKNAREISAYSSTSIEGNPLSLTEVKKIIKNKPDNLRDSEKEIANYNNALELLNKDTKDSSIRFNLDLLLRIQKIITANLISSYNWGKLRQEPVFVNNPKTGRPIYLPPNHQDAARLLKDLIDYVNQNKSRLDPLIVAGIFHKQFVIIHPFIDGNGRTARLATKVLLANMGLNTFNLFSFENYYNQNVTKYFQNVGNLGDYYEIVKTIDFTTWLEYFTDGIIDELLRVAKLLNSEALSPSATLKPYHQKILKFIEKNGFITNSDYAKLTNRAKPTRNQDFNKLIELGLIKRFGKGKATYYKLR